VIANEKSQIHMLSTLRFNSTFISFFREVRNDMMRTLDDTHRLNHPAQLDCFGMCK